MTVKTTSSRRLLAGALALLVGFALAPVASARPQIELTPWWQSAWAWVAERLRDVLVPSGESTSTSIHEKAGPHGDPWGEPTQTVVNTGDPSDDQR